MRSCDPCLSGPTGIGERTKKAKDEGERGGEECERGKSKG